MTVLRAYLATFVKRRAGWNTLKMRRESAEMACGSSTFLYAAATPREQTLISRSTAPIAARPEGAAVSDG